jgi:polyhydroxybutyrate depolymerase
MREIIEDVVMNHNVDPDRILIGGFSIGGSMTSYLACQDPTLAKAFAPVAGGFWRPHPDMGSCNGPVNLLHTHGWKDKTVPLEGRPLGGGRIYQGDIFVTLQIWREENGCENMRADSFDTSGPFWRRKWETCTAGALEFALHQGAHGIPKGWSDMTLDWFEALPE